MSSSLSAMFEQARIPLEMSSGPIRSANRDIFQLDVIREPAERVRLWPGDSDNEIEILSVDPSQGQMVLSVKEPVRPYEDRVRIKQGQVTREQIEAFVRESGGGRVLRPRGSSWIIERFTEPAQRRFLVGFDHRHLFAAQIPSGDTVLEAHEALKPAEVRAAEEHWRGKIVRQGEWFFVPVFPREENEVRQTFAFRRRDFWGHRLPSSGEPHWAESLLGLSGQRLYVRGTVHHRDHRTVCFDRWRRVYLNTEVRRRKERFRSNVWSVLLILIEWMHELVVVL